MTISRRRKLLLTRNDALAMAGFSVVSPRLPEEAPLLMMGRQFDAVLIGDSVEPELRAEIVAHVRNINPSCLVVFVRALPGIADEPLADLSIDESHGTEPLIAALEDRLPEHDGRDQAA